MQVCNLEHVVGVAGRHRVRGQAPEHLGGIARGLERGVGRFSALLPVVRTDKEDVELEFACRPGVVGGVLGLVIPVTGPAHPEVKDDARRPEQFGQATVAVTEEPAELDVLLVPERPAIGALEPDVHPGGFRHDLRPPDEVGDRHEQAERRVGVRLALPEDVLLPALQEIFALLRNVGALPKEEVPLILVGRRRAVPHGRQELAVDVIELVGHARIEEFQRRLSERLLHFPLRCLD